MKKWTSGSITILVENGMFSAYNGNKLSHKAPSIASIVGGWEDPIEGNALTDDEINELASFFEKEDKEISG